MARHGLERGGMECPVTRAGGWEDGRAREYNGGSAADARASSCWWAVRSSRLFPCLLPIALAAAPPKSLATPHSFDFCSSYSIDSMSTRHSFLSTTGLIRPSSVAYATEDVLPSRHAPPCGTKRGRRALQTKAANEPPVHRARAGIIPLGPAFIIGLAVFLSILFILSLSCAFLADEDGKPAFAALLDDVAANTPGVSVRPRLLSKHTSSPIAEDRPHRRRRGCGCRRASADHPLVHHCLRPSLHPTRFRRSTRQR